MDLKNNAKQTSPAINKITVSITQFYFGVKNAATALQLKKSKGAAA
ncbi:hypothetical protein [Foetidibacter luteolus]|nr:hypothetical protein [Foetidibacter luteolus]